MVREEKTFSTKETQSGVDFNSAPSKKEKRLKIHQSGTSITRVPFTEGQTGHQVKKAE